MSYSNSSGSVFFPTCSIIPYASVGAYGNVPAPSGYLYCDGMYYDSTNALYANLFSLIGTSYGEVDVYDSATTPPTIYFRVPNLMGISNDYYNPFTEKTTSTPFAGGSYITIGGINNSGNGNVNTTSTVFLTTDNLPSHDHTTPEQDANISATDSGHTHTLNEGTITVSSTDNGHNHTITDNGHNHGAGTGQIFSLANQTDKTGNNLYGPSLTITYSSSSTTLEGEITGNTENSTTGITITEKGYAKITSTATVTTGSFTNATGYADFSGGYADVYGVNSGNNGNGDSISIPVTPSFVMNYLIKL